MYKQNKNKGFTLVEIIAIMVILAIVAALVIPAMTGFTDKANSEAAATKARMMTTAGQIGVKKYTSVNETVTGLAPGKREMEKYMAAYLKDQLEMSIYGDARGWGNNKNSYEVGTGEMIQTGAYSWANFKSGRGTNRAVVWVNQTTWTVKGIYYMDDIHKYAVCIIYEPSNASNHFSQKGVFVEDVSS